MRRLIRLLVPLAGVGVFFLLSLVDRSDLCNRASRSCFFSPTRVCCSRRPPSSTCGSGRSNRLDDGVGLLACLLLQALAVPDDVECVLQPAVGVLGRHDARPHNDEDLRDVDRLVRSYQGSAESRRAPTASWRGVCRTSAARRRTRAAGTTTLRLRWKGRVLALGTLAAFKTFSLGMGGGVK